jgi:hypothetical protein
VKKSLFALAAMVAVVSAHAADVTDTHGKVLAIQKFQVSDDLTVDLPTTLMPGGTVCVRYVQTAVLTHALNNKSSVDAKTSSVCGKPEKGPGHGYPADLVALQTVTVDGISFQRPMIGK